MEPVLTIVIVNWNGGELLMRCLRSIRASRTSFGVRVIVVDNDSDDGSRQAAQNEFPEFLVRNSGANLGFARANNLARSSVDTPFVLFLNPDTELREDTLEKAVRCLESHPDVGALGCKMVCPDGTVQQQGLQWHLTPWRVFIELVCGGRQLQKILARWLPVWDPNTSGYVRKLYGGFLLARRKALEQAGWFDERYFMYAEDADLSRTLQTFGWRLYYTAETEITHVGGGTSSRAPSGFAVLMKYESIGKLMLKYYGLTGFFCYRLAVLFGACVRLALLMAARALRQIGNSQDFNNALMKQWLMLLWALGLRRACIPARRYGPDVCGRQLITSGCQGDSLAGRRDA